MTPPQGMTITKTEDGFVATCSLCHYTGRPQAQPYLAAAAARQHAGSGEHRRALRQCAIRRAAA